MSTKQQTDCDDAVRVGHEQEAVNVGRVLQVGIALAVIVIVAILLIAWLLNALITGEPTAKPATALPAIVSPPPSPRLDIDQPAGLLKLRQREDRELSTYEWIDNEQTAARIPIDRAMEILAEDGKAPSNPWEDGDEGGDEQ